MALNPPLTAAGVPLAVYGEFYILHRPHMKLKAYLCDRGREMLPESQCIPCFLEVIIK